MKMEVCCILLHLEDVEQADKQQDDRVDQGHKNEREAAKVLHFSVKLEVAFFAKSLVSPLNNSAKES